MTLLIDLDFMFQLQADGEMANQSVRDPSRYKPDMVRNIEKFEKAVAHFRRNGHKWQTSIKFHGTKPALYEMHSYEQFEAWIFDTQAIYQGLEILPERT